MRAISLISTAKCKISREDLTPSLRTQVGLAKMDITNVCDYIARQPYRCLGDVKRAAGYNSRLLDEAKRVLAQQGRLSQDLLSKVRGVSSKSTYVHRFGSIRRVYELADINLPLGRWLYLSTASAHGASEMGCWAKSKGYIPAR